MVCCKIWVWTHDSHRLYLFVYMQTRPGSSVMNVLCTRAFRWLLNGSGPSLFTEWISELAGRRKPKTQGSTGAPALTPPSRQDVRSALLQHPLTFHAPRLIGLPKEYSSLFRVYRQVFQIRSFVCKAVITILTTFSRIISQLFSL